MTACGDSKVAPEFFSSVPLLMRAPSTYNFNALPASSKVRVTNFQELRGITFEALTL